MSYLLDALRKAERERNLGRVPELSRAVDDVAPSAGRSLSLWVLAAVAALVVLNLLVLAVFWWSGPNREPASQRAAPEAPAAVLAPQVVPPSEPAEDAEPDALDKLRGIGPQSPQAIDSAASETPDGEFDEPTQPDELDNLQGIGQPVPQASEDAAPEFADSEFDAPAPEAEDIPQLSALPADERGRLPELRMNGHLYSSIPGRSFVLINGRRYHEGQRLPEGPALVLVDEAGAIFKYGDIRFRLDAPR